uniref:NADH dehydrogenase subunit 6 n=1 Tax=Janus sp. TaxID=3003420 RepID=A0A9E8YYX4_9HYME|nr:NADH dehydrogenase subunit 6 [Janus sp.]
MLTANLTMTLMYTQVLTKMLILYTLIITLTAPFLMSDIHPVQMMIYLIIMTTMMCLKISFMYSNFWFSYLLFLTMIGGILILFLYFVSLSSNELMNFSKYSHTMILINGTFTLALMLFKIYKFDPFSIISMESLFNNLMFTEKNWSNAMNFNSFQMFNSNYKITLMIMAYLLFVLYTLMKMCMKFYGPLRQRF